MQSANVWCVAKSVTHFYCEVVHVANWLFKRDVGQTVRVVHVELLTAVVLCVVSNSGVQHCEAAVHVPVVRDDAAVHAVDVDYKVVVGCDPAVVFDRYKSLVEDRVSNETKAAYIAERVGKGSG